MNQLQALAMNEGKRWKTKLWGTQGRTEPEKLRKTVIDSNHTEG
jgi:hypothetical protein